MAQEDYPMIPPGGGGGAPLGPGAMVANNLQAILAQRRAEEHSNLIEQLTKEKQAAEIQHWQTEDASQQEIRAANAAKRKQESEDRVATQGRLKSVADYASQQYPVDPYENNMWRMIEADPEKGQQLFNAIMTKKMTEQDNTATPWVYDETNNKWTKAPEGVTGKKGEVITRHYPPNPPQVNEANVPKPFAIDAPDPDRPGQTRIETHWLKPGQRPDFTPQSKTFASVGDFNKPGTVRPPVVPKPTKISDKTWQEFLGATQSVNKDPNNVNSVNMRDSVIKKIVAEYPATPDVKDFVNTTWMKPTARGLTPAQIISGMKPTPNQQEAQQITELWGLVSGK